MRNALYHSLIVLVLSLTACQNRQVDQNRIKEKITSSYLLIPIQEEAKEIKTSFTVGNNKETTKSFYIRLAENKIDYWVKYDVEAFKGKEIQLSFEGAESSMLGIKNIKQSDRFELDYNEPFRPGFHFSPEYGWMNDPNGLVYLDGEYHLFYQYNPYGNRWGNMHWGHAVSTDLTSWTYLPIALAPDELGDIFSGSTVVDSANTAGFGKNALIAVYTANGATQQQCIAYSTDKGRTFTKYTKNPVLPNPGIKDFRDPKVHWNEQGKQWVMALATQQTITFFGSPDLKRWTRLSEFGNETGAHGGVWECPDLFPLTYEGKTKWVLLVSINPGGPNGGSATQYFIGNFDGKKFTADPLHYPLWIDYGRDNYAGVTFSNIGKNDGRRIFMGWMSNWDYANDVPTNYFRNAMTLPRELTLKSNGEHLILASMPTAEVTKLRGKSSGSTQLLVNSEKHISNILQNFNGKFELEMTLQRRNSKIWGFGLQNDMGDYVNFTFDLEQNILKVDRRNTGIKDFNQKFVSEPIAPLVKHDSYKVRLFIDKASSEIFINDGETVLTNLVFPSQIYQSLIFFTANQPWNVEQLKIYEIK
ncbi:MAG TPA: GH32 C-terminal domain-containing protein [Bacteroidales bacterium]|nr:GH32 C-terminal domain-containing protein [Bacteroidales bacterium]